MTLIWLAAFLACDEYGLDAQSWFGDSGLLTDTAEDLADLRVDTVSPAVGPTSGNTAVTIVGAGFDDASQVFFGGTELTVTVVSDTVLNIITPAVSVEASIDITITSALGEIVVRDGYTYDDDPDTDTDTGGGGGSGATGLTAGLVELYARFYACTECFGFNSIEQISASVTRHDPVSGSWLSWLPAVGSCTGSYTPPDLGVSGDNIGSYVYLDTPGVSIELAPANSHGVLSYSASELPFANYISNTSYDVSTSSGDWALDDALLTTSTFSALEPAVVFLGKDPRFIFTESLSSSRATFSWAPTGTSDDIVVMLEVYHPQNSSFLGNVLCRSSDVGSLTIPSSYFANFYVDSPAIVSIFRIRTQQLVDPSDGHTVESMSLFGYTGTAKLVQ